MTAEAPQSPGSPNEPQPVRVRDLIGASTPGEFDLFPFLLLLRSNLTRTILCAVIGLLLAAGFAFTRKPRYAATASVLIPQQTSSSTNLAIQAATGLDLVGGGYEIYVDMLKSQSVTDRLIDRYHLMERYHDRYLSDTVKDLDKRSTILSSKEGLLTITVEDEDPKMAADLANSYFAELGELNARLGITAAGQLRHYYEGELVKEKNTLSDAEVALEESQKKTGVLGPQIQAGAALSEEENARVQLRARQVELQGLLQGSTPQNPDVIRLQAEIAGLQSQLNAIEAKGVVGGNVAVSQQPAQALDYIRRQRDVKFHESLLEILTRQYETARQQEAKDISVLEILDTARPAERKSWPNKRLWILLGGILGILIGILWTAFEAARGVILDNPINRARLNTLVRGTPAIPPHP